MGGLLLRGIPDSMLNLLNQVFGAGEGNRTLVCSLGSCRSTIELHPRGDAKQAGNLNLFG